MYLEPVFLLNMAVNLLVLYLAGRLAGERACLWRYLLSAGLGGLYAAAMLLPPCVVLTSLPAKVLLSLFMALAAWRVRSLRAYGKGWACIVGVTALGGGAAWAAGLLLQENGLPIGRNAVLLTALGAVSMVVFSASAIRRRGGGGPQLLVRVCQGQRTVRLHALLDTGNLLREPLSGLPVLIVDPRFGHRLMAGRQTITLHFGTVGGQSELAAVLADRVEVLRAGHWLDGGAMYVARGGGPLTAGVDALLPGAALE